VADPINSDLVSFINQGFKPGDLDRVGRTLRAEILERVDQVANVSGNAGTISGNVATLSGQVASLSGSVATISGNLNTLSGNTYSKTETDTLLSGKADLSGATFTGAVTVSAAATVSGVFTATSGVFITNLIDALDDTAAQASGVAVGELYRTASVVKVRVA
jgi:hypothetical protein